MAVRRGSTRAGTAAAVVVLAVGLAGCGGAEPAATAGDPDAVEATPRSLVAAVEEHLGRPATIAAPLFARDFYGSEKPPAGTLAVEAAFDEEVGDNSHLQLLVTEGPSRYTRLRCAPPGRDGAEPCVSSTTESGDELVLTWEDASFESDPGLIFAVAQRGGGAVVARYSGQEVPEALPGSDLEPLADAMLALVSDPAVGFRTSQEYAEAGEEIDDAVMLDWYGQGNGAPPPRGLERQGP